MPRKVQKYGWIPDLPDHRDVSYDLASAPTTLPLTMDLRNFCPPVYDQGQLGSCTANAIAGACETVWIREGKQDPFTPSRLAIYYGERQIEGTVGQDSGARIRDGIKVINQQGFAAENLWPYNINAFTAHPSQAYYQAAAQEKVVSYAAVPQNLDAMKQVLVAQDPIIIGFTVYESFEGSNVHEWGYVPMPQSNESVVGGHAVLIVGYDGDKDMFIVRNSWGDGWGDKGYCYFPYPYLCNPQLARDLWTVKLVP